VIDPGFTSVMSWQAIPAEENLPSCVIGQVWNFREASYVTYARYFLNTFCTLLK
jgi:hypothetical protein